MKSLFKLLLLSFFAGLFVVACSDDDDTGTDPADTEFVATDSDFADYGSWTELATNVGEDPALGAGAHGNAMSTRVIWANGDNISMENDEWPVGTILAKKMTNTETSDLIGVMAMVKRGADFNPDNNGWEWFKLNEDGTIIDRAADMNENGCNTCHGSGAGNNDYSFTLMNN